MYAILKKEFKEIFKSFKSIFIVFFLTIITFSSSKFLHSNMSEIIGGDTNSAFSASIVYLVIFFGFLFVFSISHDIVNQEIDLQTVRLLVTKTSRNNIILGKIMGVSLFWIISLAIPFTIISFYSNKLFIMDYLSLLVFIFYAVSLACLISTIINKPNITMFLGIIISIILPVLGVYSSLEDNIMMNIVKYILPFYPVLEQGFLLLIPLAISLLFIFITIILFNRKDL